MNFISNNPLISTKLKKQFLIFMFSLAVLIGAGYTMYVHFDFSHSIDTESYLKMAKGNFDVTITHRYRIIIPALAAIIAKPIAIIYKHIWPHRAESMWPLRLGFYIVNSILLALAGAIIFFTCESYGISFISSIIATIAIFSSRWAVYISGLPLIDSLYILTIALVFYGIKARASTALVLAIFLGPFAKESFIFIAPMILFFGRDVINLKKQFLLFLLSGLLVFGFRFGLDRYMQANYEQSIGNGLNHFENILETFLSLISIRGLGEIFTVLGIFTFILITGFLGGRKARKTWLGKMENYCFIFFIPVAIHMLLSGEAARMLYIACPVFAIMLGLILDHHPYFEIYRQWSQLKPSEEATPD